MIFSTITQNNLNLTADTTEIPAQYSNNIQFKFIQDSERFSGYIPTIYIGVYDSAMIECSDVISAGGAVVVDGDGVFAISNEIMYRNGFLAVGVTLTNNDENVSLKPVIYRIQASVGGLSPLPPDEGEWQQVVKAFVETLFNNWSTENLDPIKAQLEELISTAQTQQEKITSQQAQIDNAIENMGDYEIVQEDPVQIRFKKGDGTFGETVDLGDGLASKAMVNAGYYTYKGISYGGSASNNGIDVAEIDGAYSQETTNGYQLFDASKLPTKSQGGATVTNNGDGSFTVSGSGNLSESYTSSYYSSPENTRKLLKVGTLKAKVGGVVNPRIFINFTTNSGLISSKTLDDNYNFEITQEMLDNGLYFYVGFSGIKDQTIQAGTIKPMLYQDGDGTFEPFTGGIASPNPEYAQEPKFVGDIGQNLFDASKLPTKSQGGATVTNNGDGSFTISGSGNLSESFALYYELTNEEIKKIFKVGKLTLKNDIVSNPILYIDFKVGSSIKLSLTNSNLSVISGDLTEEIYNTEGLIAKVGFYGTSGMSIVGGTIKPMLYQDGDGTYRPFSETPKYYLDFVTSGKNLVNLDDVKKALGSIITIDKTSRYFNLTDNKSTTFKSVFPNLKVGKTYRIIANVLSGKTYIWYGKDGWVANKTLTITNEIYNGNLTFYISEWNNFMIVEDSETITSYAPYQGLETTTLQLNQPLRELPNGVKDTIENEVVTRRVGEITYDGSSDESWNFDTTYKYAAIDINGVTGYNIGVKNILCDKLYVINSNGSISDSTNVIRYGSSNNNNKVLYVRIDDTITSVSEFKTWLQSNPITVWYELAAPTTEQITLPTLPSWYPYTNAWVGTELQPSFVEWHIKTAGVNQNDLTVIKEDISQLQTETTQLNDDVTDLMGAFTSVTDLTKQLFLLMHRVGDIIFSTSDENPSTIYGGTWVAWGKGQVPVGVDTSDSDFNTVEKTNGTKTNRIGFLTASNNYGLAQGGGYGGKPLINEYQSDEGYIYKEFSILQPYITCYMWKRTA